MLLMHVCASSPPALPAPSILLLACPADGCPAVSGCCCGRCSCCSPEPGQPSPAGENTLYEGWLGGPPVASLLSNPLHQANKQALTHSVRVWRVSHRIHFSLWGICFWVVGLMAYWHALSPLSLRYAWLPSSTQL